jgi:hypothetical protein
MNVNVSIQDDASGRLLRFEQSISNPEAFRDDIGRRVANDLRAWFFGRQGDHSRNKFGGRSSGFWSQLRDSVSDGKTENDGVSVTISDPRFNQKYYGGDIRADTKLLAIPARAEAYDRSPRTFDNLKAIFFRSGAIALVEADRTAIKRTKKGFKSKGETGGMVYYWLVKGVHQVKDPDALPSEARLLAGILDTAEKHYNREVRKAQE